MEKKLTFKTEKECPLCSKSFTVIKTRVGLKLISMDTDFRMKYEGVDPYLYVVWVCPHCGYAVPDTCFSPLSEGEKTKLKKALAGKQVGVNLQGERTVDQAIASYKLALYFAELRKLPNSQIAGLFLKMAWLYRDREDKEMEQSCLTKALEHYMEAFSRERFPIGKMTENAMGYLVANLLDRVGRTNEALTWLGKVVNQRTHGESKILDMARDLWHDLKEKREKETADTEKG